MDSIDPLTPPNIPIPVDERLCRFKPDFPDAEKRWQAYLQKELVDRPPVVVTALRDRDSKMGQSLAPPLTYHDKVFEEVDRILDQATRIIESTYWGGDAIPSFYPSFGPDEIAVFCGAQLNWSPDSVDTNWSEAVVSEWEESLPIGLITNHPLFQKQLELYRQASSRFQGAVTLVAPDLHTNMDLLAALRGPQRLCVDLLDCPDLIDLAMQDARRVFKELWRAINLAGDMPGTGYALESHTLFSRNGSATIQCDFSIMLSPAMFRRWVLPAIEEEAAIVGNVVYHWDGPGALVHKKDLLGSAGIHTLSFVPGDGNGNPVDYIDLLKEFQENGKSVHAWGSPEECKRMHKELHPDRVFYCTQTRSQSEAEELLNWFTLNT